MKQKISLIQLGIATVAMFAISLIFGASDIFAAERVWTGDGSDNNLATAANWQGGVAPVDGDDLVFNEGVTVSNDLDSSITIDGIVANEYVDIEGNTFSIQGSLVGSVAFLSNVTIVGDTTANDYLYFGGNISGSGNLILNASIENVGYLQMASANNSGYTGEITANNFSICADVNANTFGSTGAGTTMTGGMLTLTNISSDITIAEDFTLEDARISTGAGGCGQGGGGPSQPIGQKLTLSGAITVTPPVTFGGTAHLIITNPVVGGTVALESDSIANLTIAGSTQQVAQQTITVNNQGQCDTLTSFSFTFNYTAIVNANCSDLILDVLGILRGTGYLGNVYIGSGGMIAPGSSPGTINTGNLFFSEGGIYEFEVAGAESGQYDQINVTGSVNIDGGILKAVLLGDFTPSLGQSFVIINNDGSDAVQGTFADLPEGAVVEIDGEAWFTISYKGGDGNDVELTALPGPARTGGQPEVGLPVVAVFTGAITTVVLAGFIIKRRFMTR